MHHRLLEAFLSTRLQPAEYRCNTFGRKLLAVYIALRNFWHVLEGRPFRLFTDHKRQRKRCIQPTGITGAIDSLSSLYQHGVWVVFGAVVQSREVWSQRLRARKRNAISVLRQTVFGVFPEESFTISQPRECSQACYLIVSKVIETPANYIHWQCPVNSNTTFNSVQFAHGSSDLNRNSGIQNCFNCVRKNNHLQLPVCFPIRSPLAKEIACLLK